MLSSEGTFDAFVHGGALVAAIDFALAHSFAVDALREPRPLVDEVFFDALEVSLAADGALAVRVATAPR